LKHLKKLTLFLILITFILSNGACASSAPSTKSIENKNINTARTALSNAAPLSPQLETDNIIDLAQEIVNSIDEDIKVSISKSYNTQVDVSGEV